MDALQKAKRKLSNTIVAQDREKKILEGLGKQREAMNSDTKEKQKNLEILEKKIADLADDFAVKSGASSDLGKEVKEKQNELSDVLSVIEERESRLKDVNSKIEEAKKSKTDLIKKVDDNVAAHSAKLNVDIKKLESERDGLMDGNKSIAKGNTDIKEETNRLAAENSAISNELSKNKSFLDKVKSDVEVNEEMLLVQADTANKLEDTKKELKKEIKALEDAKVGADEIYKKSKAKLDKIERNQFALSEKAEHLKQQEEYVKEQFKRAAVEYTPYDEKVYTK